MGANRVAGLMAVAASMWALSASAASSELEAPFIVKTNGVAIDLEVGHAHPLFMDFDGDGLPDLLIGQFGGGKMRIYRNVGTRTNPEFKDYTLFQAGGKTASVNYG